MPDVPTVDESGVPGYDVTGWFGLLAPAKTPKPVLDRLTDEVRKAATDPRFLDRMTNLCASGLDDFGPFLSVYVHQHEHFLWCAADSVQTLRFNSRGKHYGRRHHWMAAAC
jgi:hypothetical protein